jgi:hypothetical protein
LLEVLNLTYNYYMFYFIKSNAVRVIELIAFMGLFVVLCL